MIFCMWHISGPFLLPNWRDFATQLGSKFFPVGASIRSISLAAGFILSSDAVFTCDPPNSGSYGKMPPLISLMNLLERRPFLLEAEHVVE